MIEDPVLSEPTPVPCKPTKVTFDDDRFWVHLEDGRVIGAPLNWFPRLERGTPAERKDYMLSPSSVLWDELDEDISVRGLLPGHKDITRGRRDAP